MINRRIGKSLRAVPGSMVRALSLFMALIGFNPVYATPPPTLGSMHDDGSVTPSRNEKLILVADENGFGEVLRLSSSIELDAAQALLPISNVGDLLAQAADQRVPVVVGRRAVLATRAVEDAPAFNAVDLSFAAMTSLPDGRAYVAGVLRLSVNMQAVGAQAGFSHEDVTLLPASLVVESIISLHEVESPDVADAMVLAMRQSIETLPLVVDPPKPVAPGGGIGAGASSGPGDGAGAPSAVPGDDCRYIADQTADMVGDMQAALGNCLDDFYGDVPGIGFTILGCCAAGFVAGTVAGCLVGAVVCLLTAVATETVELTNCVQEVADYWVQRIEDAYQMYRGCCEETRACPLYAW